MVGTSATRTRGRAGLAALAVLAVLGTAACGEQQAGGPTVSSSPTSGSADATTPSTSPSTGTAAPVPGESSVTVTLDDGSGTTSTWTLTCAAGGTAGGDHPDAAAACAALAAAGDPFKPVPKDMACTMVFGGPQKATVRGTWDGQAVTAAFDRTDGCQIARWDRIAPVLQPGTTAGRSAGAM